ncbi:hypothetical protein JBL43_15170 [Aureibaculum sp. A20]|uniref:Lipoprotein n=1 Tax=Aureibaculum flavum TaxID=2795986 RepID=A0ABS0WUC6_9FLAO|nr:hypothetical protein [Aureibaculum flavum]MBJ2175591.1 hypothetical protein [Aureibaculum flavum]
MNFVIKKYKTLLLLLLTIGLVSCSGTKKTQEALNSGNYYSAINASIAKLSANKTKKGNQKYITMLEDAFAKNTKRENKEINFLLKEGNEANYEKVYNSYLELESIQERIQPLLPLYLSEEGRKAKFSFSDYTNKILASKEKLASYLYSNASGLAESATTKYDYRKAYDDFTYLEELSPGYKDTKQRIEDVYVKGIDYVKVKSYNASDKIIPEDLENELLNFNTYGLNDLWTTYHTNPQKDINYNYEMVLEFVSINISPEAINEKQLIKEKQIKDGWKYVLDTNGNVTKDSLGNDIKEDKFIKVKSVFNKLTQHKEANITAKVSYFDLQTNQLINAYPITSGFVFEHIYGNYNGDKRSLDSEYLGFSSQKSVPFPTSEQMIYDSGEDLKLKIKNIVKAYKFN